MSRLTPCEHGLIEPHHWQRFFINEDGGHDYSWGDCFGAWEKHPKIWVRWYEGSEHDMIVEEGESDQ